MLEEKEWNLFRKYLDKKRRKKAFDDLFSIARLYNSSCLYAVNSIRIYPIMMSIVLYHYKILKEKNFDNYFYYDSNDIDINNTNSDNDNTILKSEIEKWNNFSSVLRKQN